MKDTDRRSGMLDKLSWGSVVVGFLAWITSCIAYVYLIIFTDRLTMTITEMEHHEAMVAWLVFITPALLAISSCFMGIVAEQNKCPCVPLRKS